MRTISKEKAIAICAQWDGGQWCPLYSFLSTGKIHLPINEYIAVINENLQQTTTKKDVKELKALKNFFLHSGKNHFARNGQINNGQRYEVRIPEHLICFYSDGEPGNLTDSEIHEANKYLQRLTVDAKRYGKVESCIFSIVNEQKYFAHSNSVNNLGADCYDCVFIFHY